MPSTVLDAAATSPNKIDHALPLWEVETSQCIVIYSVIMTPYDMKGSDALGMSNRNEY